ncbi:MAG: type IV pilus twitching motility protein PilT [Methylacidiphilales bacterium]|nr:type IV pilus twitching motility protein PilT [Candidatus Methylacidiphilales bacterium]
MSPEYNEYALSTAYHSGWITLEQYHSAVAALKAMPHLSAIDFLLEQTIITPEQADGLRQSIQAAVAAPTVTVVHESPRAAVDASLFPNGMGINELLRLGYDAGASDVHLGVSAPALMRRHGVLQPLYHDARPLEPEQTEALVRSFLNPLQLATLEKNKGLDFSYEVPGMTRFRTSVIRQRKGYDAVFRIINTKVRSMDDLGLPESLKVLTQYHNGLVLITGAVGSGKSTTLAAMVDEINRHRRDHIITLEDPIEYVFTPAGCQITQREVHSHTESFSTALRASLREDPDVIMVGEMRDLETISLAITASETGHLVLATLHTGNAARTLDRILDAFPVEQQGQIRTMVSESLRGIISQQLIPKVDGSGRVIALEIMVNTPAVANLIRESKTFMLPGIIQTGKKLGMRLMDDSMLELVENGIISPHEAFDRAEQKKHFEDYLT